MARNRKTPAPKPPADAGPAPVPAGPSPDGASGRKAARVFLMVAGGLAAPCLALAAFFLSGSSGGSDKPARPAATQSGRVTGTGTSAASRPSGTAAGASVTTTTTTAPGPVATPPRDPFAPLVNTAPATPGK